MDKIHKPGRGPQIAGGGFSKDSPALINPAPLPGECPVTPWVVMTFALPVYRLLWRMIEVQGRPRCLWESSVCQGVWQGRPLTLVSPAMGAPYATMVMERLIALGARRILALGWCGSLQPEVRIGSLVLPTGAVPGDGTSPHYLTPPDLPAPHSGLHAALSRALQGGSVPWQAGPIWTMDAFYRETAALVSYYQSLGCLGVDLEMAALFAVGQFRQIAVAGLLVVSDELFTLKWRPGFRSPVFRRGREEAARLVLQVITEDDDDY